MFKELTIVVILLDVAMNIELLNLEETVTVWMDGIGTKKMENVLYLLTLHMYVKKTTLLVAPMI